MTSSKKGNADTEHWQKNGTAEMVHWQFNPKPCLDPTSPTRHKPWVLSGKQWNHQKRKHPWFLSFRPRRHRLQYCRHHDLWTLFFFRVPIPQCPCMHVVYTEALKYLNRVTLRPQYTLYEYMNPAGYHGPFRGRVLHSSGVPYIRKLLTLNPACRLVGLWV